MYKKQVRLFERGHMINYNKDETEYEKQITQISVASRRNLGPQFQLEALGDAVSPPKRVPPFLEIQDVLTFYRPIRKIKVLKDCFNRFVYNFYP